MQRLDPPPSAALIHWCRAITFGALALAVLIAWPLAGHVVRAQDEEILEPMAPATSTRSATGSSEASGGPQTLWDMFLAGGIVGYLILLLSIVALGFAIEHALTIRKATLMPDDLVAEVEELIHRGNLNEALELCKLPENHCLYGNVVAAGLERYKSSEFGFAEYRAAVEEAGEEQTNRLYRKTEVLAIVAAVAPMLGLLGTVQGMIIAFNQIASSGGTAKPHELAAGISLALVTTFEGLVVAIPCMIALSWFRNQIDSLVSETGKRVEQTLAPLGRRRGA